MSSKLKVTTIALDASKAAWATGIKLGRTSPKYFKSVRSKSVDLEEVA